MFCPMRRLFRRFDRRRYRAGLSEWRSSARDRCGATLVEVMIAITVLSALVTAVCGTYMMIQNQWGDQRAREECRTAATQAICRVSDYLKVANSAYVSTRFTPNDTLRFYLPLDRAYGIYVQQPGLDTYRPDNMRPYYFYLSDSTGDYGRNGNILWAGCLYYGHVVGDQGWSLHSGTRMGKIQPVRSISFQVDTTGYRPRVTTTIRTTSGTGSASDQLALSAVSTLRNSDE